MNNFMTPKPPPTLPKVATLNPRYKGATPEMVGKALLRQLPKSSGNKPPAPGPKSSSR